MREFTKEIFGNYPRDIETLKAMLGHKWKGQLEDLKLLAETYRYYPRKKIRMVYLSVSGRRMINLFGYSRKASRVIKTALSIGMMAVVSNDVRYSCREPKSRCFVVNRDVVDLILNSQVETNVSINVSIISNTHDTPPNYDNNNVGEEEVKSLNLHDLELLNISIDSARKDIRACDVDDSVLMASLYSRYPQLADYTVKSQRINSHYENNSIFSINVRPNIKRHGMQYVTFGYRPHSYFCSVPKQPEDGFLSREDILEEKFGTWTEYDVKSSIYRVTYALNNGGRWPDEEVDLYGEFWGGDFSSQESRDNFKKMCMLVYFNQSDKAAAKSILDPDNDIYIPASWSKADVLRFAGDLRESMVERIGKFYGSEIFVHEGCVYMDVLEGLQKLGMDVVEIYDCFYVRGECSNLKEICSKLIKYNMSKYIDRYI